MIVFSLFQKKEMMQTDIQFSDWKFSFSIAVEHLLFFIRLLQPEPIKTLLHWIFHIHQFKMYMAT